ncbi:DUF445 domain-containing protein [Sphingomonas endolithica]|uniref:DUF445 domain-containing protein n=1 Tax=Sphingomonas endolithica TaxID=2972485 RepID=UPI0021B0311F|nr:DUF445 domain-containing protein [Sphingomonas sp. ZFBP2030]
MKLFVRAPRLSEAPPEGLRRMRIIATGLLVFMAATFIATRALDNGHPAFGFVQAFAEAAMVGGLADWFAVTALFRHPLGVPIPHTAIIPRNKDRIGDTLAIFLRDNFLTPVVISRRMRRMDVASIAGEWLANPGTSSKRLTRGCSRLAIEILQALDQERLGGMVRGAMVQQVRNLQLAPLLGQALGAAMADDRHLPILNGIVRAAGQILETNEHLVRAMVHERAGAVMRWTGLDETLSNKIIDGLKKLVRDMAEDPDHPLRGKAEEALATLAHDLQHAPEMAARVDALKLAMLENPAMQGWINGLWEQARTAMLRVAQNPEKLLAGKFGDALKQLGETLQRDSRLRATINRFVRRAVVGTAADYGDGIVRLVSETVRGWDAETITGRLENAVGKDLQYIRVNGTLVGGLVGLVIHTIDTWL